MLSEHVADDHVLGLRTAGEADFGGICFADDVSNDLFSEHRFGVCGEERHWASSSLSKKASPAIWRKASMVCRLRSARAETAVTPASCKARTAPGNALLGIRSSSTMMARRPRWMSVACRVAAACGPPLRRKNAA